MKWWAFIFIAIGFAAGITDWFRSVGWPQLVVLAVLGAFIAIVMWHAKKETDGS